MTDVEQQIALFAKWRKDHGTQEAHVRRLERLVRIVASEREQAIERVAELETMNTQLSPALDRFGATIGSKCNMINMVLTTRSQTPLTIAEKIGLTRSRVKAHLSYLESLGYIVETSRGYRLKDKSIACA